MADPVTVRRIQSELRFLKLYAVFSSLVIGVLAMAAFRGPRRDAFDVIDVKRINVMNDAGTPALVIAGLGRLPGPTFGGKEYPQELSGGRTGASGMIFFNEQGDEVGGLIFAGKPVGDGYHASSGLMFDQFHQDQVVGLQYQDNGTSRNAGLSVWDRSTQVSIARILELAEADRTATGAARDSVEPEPHGVPRAPGPPGPHPDPPVGGLPGGRKPPVPGRGGRGHEGGGGVGTPSCPSCGAPPNRRPLRGDLRGSPATCEGGRLIIGSALGAAGLQREVRRQRANLRPTS